METERKLNISKIIITIISALILVIIIAILTKFLTNKKQAAEVAPETSQTQVANQENIWKTTNKDEQATQSENQSEKTGKNNNQIENKVQENVSTNSNVPDNSTIENNSGTENTYLNQAENTATQTGSNATENNTITTNNNNTQNNDVATDQKKSNNGVIWLTFDDGPSANLTPKVLDILKKENVKATFFVINYSQSNEHLIKRIVAEGHTIGIHGYSHEYSKIYKSKDTFMNNIYTLQDKIYKSTGVKSMYIRFPGGSSNTVSRKYCKGIMTELTKEVLSKGFKYFDWNISSGDAGGAKNAKAVYKNVTKNLSKKRGNLVLCHDIHQKTLEALPDIIKYAKKEGYTFARIDDSTPMYAQHVNN